MSLLNPPNSLIDVANATVTSARSTSLSETLLDFTGGLLDPDIFDGVIEDISKFVLLGDASSIAEILSQFTEYPPDILENIINDSGFLFNIDIGNIGNSIVNFLNDLQDFNTFIIDYVESLFDEFGGGVGGYLDNIVSSSSGGAKETIQSIADVPIPEGDKEVILNALQEDDLETASNTLAKYSDREVSVLRFLLEQLDVTIAGTVVINSTLGIFPTAYDVGSNLFLWSGGNEPDPNLFSYISTEEELDAEFSSITREVTEIVVHWTETFSNANLIAEQIHDAHNALGHNGIAYHYIIRRDGSLQRGRPVDVQGEHCATNNHNLRSIGIAFVGGLNISSPDSVIDGSSSAASLTRQQFNTFNKFIKSAFLHYPGMQVLGHNDIDPNEEDPGFDVIDYCYTKFNKVSLFDDPANQEPFTTEEINSYWGVPGDITTYIKNDWVLY